MDTETSSLQIHVKRRTNACEQVLAFAREQGVTLHTFDRKLAKQSGATLAS